ncbi:hypothetical protein GEMRC1_013370 [Eukaryota sp. GEM-RC1]
MITLQLVPQLKGGNTIDVSTSTIDPTSYNIPDNSAVSLSNLDFAINFGHVASSVVFYPTVISSCVLFACTLQVSEHQYCSSCSHDSFPSLQLWASNPASPVPALLASYQLPHGCPRSAVWVNTHSDILLSVVLGNGDLLTLSLPVKERVVEWLSMGSTYNPSVIELENNLVHFHFKHHSCLKGIRSIIATTINTDHELIAVGTDDGRLVVFDPLTFLIDSHDSINLIVADSPIMSITCDPQNHQNFSLGCFDGSVYHLNIFELNISKSKVGLDPVSCICWPTSSRAPVFSSLLGKTTVLEGKKRQILRNHSGLQSLIDGSRIISDYSPFYSTVVCGGNDGFLRTVCFNMEKGKNSGLFQSILIGCGIDCNKESKNFVSTVCHGITLENFSIAPLKNGRVFNYLKNDGESYLPVSWRSCSLIGVNEMLYMISSTDQMGRLLIFK